MVVTLTSFFGIQSRMSFLNVIKYSFFLCKIKVFAMIGHQAGSMFVPSEGFYKQDQFENLQVPRG